VSDLSFELGGIVVPLHACLNFRQTYRWLGGLSILRSLNGAGTRQTHWRKLATTLSAGEGWEPEGLMWLDPAAELTLKCAGYLPVQSGSNVITLPRPMRAGADYAPRGYAILSDGLLYETTIALAGLDATLGVVTGAVQYRVHFWPELTVLANPAQSDADLSAASRSWSIECEEV
jgi:hypothetical protein